MMMMNYKNKFYLDNPLDVITAALFLWEPAVTSLLPVISNGHYWASEVLVGRCFHHAVDGDEVFR